MIDWDNEKTARQAVPRPAELLSEKCGPRGFTSCRPFLAELQAWQALSPSCRR